jgi:hypothetical protein
MNPSARHNISLHLSEIEAMLHEEVKKLCRLKIKAVDAAAAKRRRQHTEQSTRRAIRMVREVESLRKERDAALDWAAFCEEKARDADFALRDGQAYARELGRQLEELKNAHPAG